MEIILIALIAYVVGLNSGYILAHLEAERQAMDLEERTRKILAPGEESFKYQQQRFEEDQKERQKMADFHGGPGY